MKFFRNIFIFIFLFLTPIGVDNNIDNVPLIVSTFTLSWGFLFFWTLGGLWHFLFGTSLFGAVKNLYINNKTKVSLFVFVLTLFLLPIILLLINPINSMDSLYVFWYFSWGFLSVYFAVKLAKYFFRFINVKLEEIFPNINNEKILFLKIFLFILLPASVSGLNSITTNEWILASPFILFIIWVCRILYKFIKATVANGSLLTVIIFVVIIIVIISYIRAIPSTPEPTEEQKAKERICKVVPELEGC
tara:strand:+ start:209 stop:949 length:741 start_codon:yes stop_codon:yes gene_type:complete